MFVCFVWFLSLFSFLQHIGVTTQSPSSENAYLGSLYNMRENPESWVLSAAGIIRHHGSEKVTLSY